jgi:hypothetical protein
MALQHQFVASPFVSEPAAKPKARAKKAAKRMRKPGNQ